MPYSRATLANVAVLLASVKKCPECVCNSPYVPIRHQQAPNMLSCYLDEDHRMDSILITAIHPSWAKADPTARSMKGCRVLRSSPCL
uniref:Uncharacterized protein n=1 Tax=Paramormyrops kingsleyae TaxID=1676925 RepID=A0A3B3R999_9TELE